MEKNNSNQKPKKIKTKQSLLWHSAMLFLASFRCQQLMEDKGFADLYYQMKDYVFSKIELKTDDDVTDIYVVVEQLQENN